MTICYDQPYSVSISLTHDNVNKSRMQSVTILKIIFLLKKLKKKKNEMIPSTCQCCLLRIRDRIIWETEYRLCINLSDTCLSQCVSV